MKRPRSVTFLSDCENEQVQEGQGQGNGVHANDNVNGNVHVSPNKYASIPVESSPAAPAAEVNVNANADPKAEDVDVNLNANANVNVKADGNIGEVEVEAKRILIDNKVFRKSCTLSYVNVKSGAFLRLAASVGKESNVNVNGHHGHGNMISREIDVTNITDVRCYNPVNINIQDFLNEPAFGAAIGNNTSSNSSSGGGGGGKIGKWMKRARASSIDSFGNDSVRPHKTMSYLVLTASANAKSLFLVIELSTQKLQSFMNEMDHHNANHTNTSNNNNNTNNYLMNHLRANAQPLTNEKAKFISSLLGNKPIMKNMKRRFSNSNNHSRGSGVGGGYGHGQHSHGRKKVAFDNLCLVASASKEIETNMNMDSAMPKYNTLASGSPVPSIGSSLDSLHVDSVDIPLPMGGTCSGSGLGSGIGSTPSSSPPPPPSSSSFPTYSSKTSAHDKRT